MVIRNICFAAATASLLCACASVKDVEDYNGTIAPGNGVLVIVVSSDTGFQDLRLMRPHDAISAIAARNLPQGRSVRFVELPAGDYQWTRVDLSDNGYYHSWIPLDKDKEQRYHFTVKAGTINYPGDFVVATDNGAFSNRYYIQLVDRSAMLLETINPDQRKMLDTTGWVYDGPGIDDFPGYFRLLTVPKGKQP